MRSLIAVSLVLIGCNGEVPADPSACVISDACGEVFCADPTVRIGEGSRAFAALQDGVMELSFGGVNGGGCGYHVDLAIETANLCDVLTVNYRLDLVGLDGSLLFEADRRVLMLRESETSSVQSMPGFRAFMPVEHYPDDPERADLCPENAGEAGHCDAYDVLVTVNVADDGGRTAMAQEIVELACCG